jgi:hypothetical protein
MTDNSFTIINAGFKHRLMKKINETRKPAGEVISVGKDGSKSLGPAGEMITTEYECPCGKGKIAATFEDIPGYRESYAHIECEECNKIYKVTYNWARSDEPVLEKAYETTNRVVEQIH